MRSLRCLVFIVGCALSFPSLSRSQPAAADTAGPDSPPRVIVLSWDGAAYWMTSRLLAEGRLPNLQRLMREGAWSDGMITSFPTKTAAGHAMLWTGRYGHSSGVTGNAVLREPASEHSLLESRSGYFSDVLKVEPLWVMTARAGLMTYTFHATQSYPFQKHFEPLGSRQRERLQMIYGYAGISLPAEVLSAENTPTRQASGWTLPEAMGDPSVEFPLAVGERQFWGVFFDDPFDPDEGLDTLGLAADKQDTAFLARVKPGERGSFSVPIETTVQGKPLGFSLRLFEMERSGSHFLIYRSSAEVVEVSSPGLPGAGDLGIAAFAGNGGGALYRRGGLGPPIYEGGTGKAEHRFLETLAHLTGQIRRQAQPILDRGDYRVLMLYTPVPDEVGHALTGYLDPTLAGHDEALAERLWTVFAKAMETEDALLGWVMAYAGRVGAHVLLVSDHGMAGTDRAFNVNVALERAGLLALTRDRQIDLSRTRALLLPLDDGSVAVNTTDREGGIVPLDEKETVLREVRDTLLNVVDPETGTRVVKGLFETSTNGLLQPGGKTTGDLFLDLLPGYYFSFSTETDALVDVIPPLGDHIFVPTRRDMLAIFAAWGPRVPPGDRFHRVSATALVPTVLDILDLPSDEKLPGRSVLPRKTLLQTSPVRDKP